MSPPRRNYIQKSGRKVFGVTTQDILDKPGLRWWAYGQGIENYYRLSEAVGRILTDESDMAAASKLERIQELIVDFQVLGLYERRDEAGDAGTLAHEYIENHLRGLPEPDASKYSPAAREKAEGCYLTCLDWVRGQKLTVIDSEVQLVSERTPVGGTIDHVIKTVLTENFPDAVEIWDVKTGKDIYLGAKIQVAKYKSLWEERYPHRPVMGLHITRFGPTGEYTHKFFPELNAYEEIFDLMSLIFYKLKDLGEKI